jgi:hypothetical protein
VEGRSKERGKEIKRRARKNGSGGKKIKGW